MTVSHKKGMRTIDRNCSAEAFSLHDFSAVVYGLLARNMCVPSFQDLPTASSLTQGITGERGEGFRYQLGSQPTYYSKRSTQWSVTRFRVASPFVDLHVDASSVLAGCVSSRVLVPLDVVHLQRCGQQVLHAVEDASKNLDRNRAKQLR